MQFLRLKSRGARRFALALSGCLSGLPVVLPAAPLYWDTNGAAVAGQGTTGSGTNSTGTWGVDAFWNSTSSGSGATGAYVAGSDVFFSAGGDASNAYVVTVSGIQAANSLTFEDGTVHLAGGTVQLANGGTITVNTTNAYLRTILAGGGTNGITINGAGTLYLQSATTNQNNTYTGTLTIGSGVAVQTVGSPSNTFGANGAIKGNFVVESGGTLTSGAVNIIADSAIATINGVWNNAGFGDAIGAYAGTGRIHTGTTMTLRPTSVQTFSGVIAGPGGVNFDNSGNSTQVFASANLFTGSVTFSNDATTSLRLDHAQAMQFSQALTFSGTIGAVDSLRFGTAGLTYILGGGIASVATAPGNMTLAQTGTGSAITLQIGSFVAPSQVSGSYMGVLSGAGGIIKDGRSTLTQSFSQAQTYTGSTVVNRGALSSTTTSGTAFGTGSIVMNGGEINLTPATGSGAVGLTGATSAGAAFTYAGGAALNLNRNGNTSLTYTVGNNGAASLARLNRGTLLLGYSSAGSLGVTESFIVNGLTSATNLNGIYAAQVAAHTGDVGTFVKYDDTNGFVLAASGTSSYTARSDTITAGTTAATEVSDVAAGTTFSGSNTLYAARMTGAVGIDAGAVLTINGVAAGTGSSGVGGLILNTATVGASPSTGTVAFGSSEGVIHVWGSNTINSVITGTAGVTIAGPGTLNLAGVNTFTGGLNINQGVLSVTANNQLGGAGNQITLNGGTLSFGANFTMDRGITIGAGGGGLTNGGVNANIQVSGALTGSGPLTINGGAATQGINLTNANSGYSGDIFINSGRILLNNAAGTVGTGSVYINGANGAGSLYVAVANKTIANRFFLSGNGGENLGAIRMQTTGTNLTGEITLLANAGISSDQNSSINTISGNITGAYELTLGIGTGTVVGQRTYILTGTNTHASTATASILQINSDAALGVAAGSLTLNSQATFKAGAANMVINPTRAILLGSGAFVTFDTNGFDMTIAGEIRGVTNLHNIAKAGAGSLILTGVNTYAGSTFLVSGTLQVGAGGTASAPANGSIISAVTVNANPGNLVVLAGTGKITGAVTVTSGELRPGDNAGASIGTLTLGNTLTLGAAGKLRFGADGVTGNISSAVGYDGTQTGAALATLISTFNPNLLTGHAETALHDHLQFSGALNDMSMVAGAQIILNPSSYVYTNGDVLNLIDWVTVMEAGDKIISGATFGNRYNGAGDELSMLDLPTLGAGLLWDTSLLQGYGVLVVVTPEPSRALLLLLGTLGLLLRRRR